MGEENGMVIEGLIYSTQWGQYIMAIVLYIEFPNHFCWINVVEF